MNRSTSCGVATVTLLVVSLLHSGCETPDRGISISEPKPLKAEFASHAARPVGMHYLLIPIRMTLQESEGFMIGSWFFSGSSWSGLGFGSGFGSGGNLLNVQIVDLTNGTHRRVFDRQVAIGSIDLSFQSRRGIALNFDDLLIVSARASDANGDKRIDVRDPVHLFAYRFSTGHLSRLSPDGYYLDSARIVGDSIVMILHEQRDPTRTAVYSYDPATGAGSFVVRELTP